MACVSSLLLASRNTENDREASLFEVIRHSEITVQKDEQNSGGSVELFVYQFRRNEFSCFIARLIFADGTNGHAQAEDEDDVVMIENGDTDVRTLKRKIESADQTPEKKIKV